MDANPPHLVSPVDHLTVRAVLDQDATLTAGLATSDDGIRSVVLVAAAPGFPYQREEFLAWGRALASIAGAARIAPIAGFGHTDDGRAYLATYVDGSLADYLRVAGQLSLDDVRGIGAVLADALATAHSYGISHAAVSPATVLIADDGARLGGFGATAPTLAGPLGVWAFTAPEHRASAAAGNEVASPAADVFALAATLCVALAGALPWSDPITWADAASLPSTPDAPGWVTTIRAALAADPDQRPSAEEFAHALRSQADEVMLDFHGAKVDLRALIPRTVRRLAANNMDAMADGVRPTWGRARAQVVRPTKTVRRDARTRRVLVPVVGAAVLVAATLTSFVLFHRHSTHAATNGPAQSAPSQETLRLMAGAREASEAWIREIGAGDAAACQLMRGRNQVITAGRVATPMSCGDLLTHRSTLLPANALTAMRSATVLEVTGLTTGLTSESNPRESAPTTIETSDNGVSHEDAYAFVTLPYVPSLETALHRLEITMTYQDGRWWVAAVDVG